MFYVILLNPHKNDVTVGALNGRLSRRFNLALKAC